MKRILPLILTVLLLPALLAVPVFAEENQFWYELLDYGVSQYGSNHITLDSVTVPTRKYIRYENPLGSVQSYFDIIFRTDDTSPRIVSSTSWLTVVNVSGDVWRAYGKSGIIGTYFYLEYDDGTFVDILSFKASPISFDMVDTHVYGELYNYSDNNGQDPYLFNYQADGIAVGGEFWTLTDYDNTFLSEMVVSEWFKYDYVDFHVALFCSSVNSIRAYLTDGSLVPVEVSTLLTGMDGNTNFYIVNVRCDLTEVLRDSSHSLVLDVTGSGVKGELNGFWLYRCNGILLPVTDNILVYWFTQLDKWLDSGFSSIVDALGGSNDASGVQDSINSAVGELEQVQGVLDGVARPDLDAIDFDVSGLVDVSAAATYGNIFSTLIGNQYMTNILMIAFILAAASFLLFGRR